MQFDKAAYRKLEERFKEQVGIDNKFIRDNLHMVMGTYFPVQEPQAKVDFVFIGMEPSSNFAGGSEGVPAKIEEGFRNFCVHPDDHTSSLSLYRQSIERFLCGEGETYYLTDLAKGAMSVAVAALNRQTRYEQWYPLFKEELEIMGKSGAPIIAIGKAVYEFLKTQKLEEETGRRLHRILHYSRQAAGQRKKIPQQQPDRFREFCAEEFDGPKPRWSSDISESGKHLVFTYKVQFEAIRNEMELARPS